jgi:hypothetical protein
MNLVKTRNFSVALLARDYLMSSLLLFSTNDIALFLVILIRMGTSVLYLLLFSGSANVISLPSYPSLVTASFVLPLLSDYLLTLLLPLLPHPFSLLSNYLLTLQLPLLKHPSNESGYSFFVPSPSISSLQLPLYSNLYTYKIYL